jgi:hypothetical protein
MPAVTLRTSTLAAAQEQSAFGLFGLPHMLYENHYVWFVFLSTLDLLYTWIILLHGGQELNNIADLVIQSYGIWGLLAFKFSLVTLVVIMIEIIGRNRPQTGLRVAWTAIFITIFPVTVGLSQLVMFSAVRYTIFI